MSPAAGELSKLLDGDDAANGGADAAASFAHAVIACDVTAAPSGLKRSTHFRRFDANTRLRSSSEIFEATAERL